MTIKLRARVTRAPRSTHLAARFNVADPRPWLVTATTGLFPGPVLTQRSPSHPEAIQAAHKLLADLDAVLMAEVHASQGRRREARAAKLAAEEATA